MSRLWDIVKHRLVQYKKDPVTGGIRIIAKVTQAQYDAIAVKDDSTLYVIVG